MARVNDVTIRLAADVTKLKTGFSSAGQSVRQLSAQVQALTNGQIKLTSAGRFYDAQRKQFISTAKAEQVISKGLQREYTRTQTAVTAVANATKAAVEAEVQKINASKSLAQISKETIASFSASGNAVQHLTARLVALTKGEYLLTASGQILNATTQKQAQLSDVAAAATARLSMEQTNLRTAYAQATAGMDASQKRLLDTQMAMTGLSSITGSASFAAISMGQIFQDMGQFGMGAAQGVRAITNNVQQTVQSLVMLSAMTAKGESVFKAFTTALKGPVGFLVAFSAVTGLIELFSNRAQRASKEAEKLGEAINETFSLISPIAGSAQLSIEELTRRQEILTETVSSYEEQIDFVDKKLGSLNASNSHLRQGLIDEKNELEKLLPRHKGYLNEINNEISSHSDLGKALEDSKRLFGDEGIEASAVAKAKSDLSKKNFELREEYALLSVANNTEIQELKDQNVELEKQISLRNLLQRANEGEFVAPSGASVLPTFSVLGGFDKDDPEAFFDALVEGAEMSRDLLKDLSIEVEEAFLSFFPDLPEPGDLNLGVRLWTEADEEAAANLRQAIPYISEFDREIDALQRTMSRLGGQGVMTAMPELNAMIGMFSESMVQLMNMPDPETLGLGKALETEADKADEMTKAMERLNAAMARTAAQGIAKVATGLLDVAIGGESFKAAILGPIADMAIQLGKIAIATGLTMEKLKFSFSSPFAAIAAGTALVVAGKLVKSTIKSAERGASGASSGAGMIRGASMTEFNVGNLYSGTPNIGSAAGFPSLSIGSMAPQEMQLQLVARGPDLVSAVDAQRSANTRLIGGSR